ncbi:hypothetical protein FRC07_003702 [Ceratobasidium sp. 392]|nr:hypothetical protein FRC07_003702 [Ceratobasidium sp. 392]
MAATPSDLAAYKKLLGLLATSNQTPLHCVRCHASYLEQENNTGVCRIPHDEPEYLGDDASDDYPYSNDGIEDLGSMMKYPCCGERFRQDEMDGGDGFCVEGPQTTDPKKVEYFIKPTTASTKKRNDAGYRPDHYGWYKIKNSGVVTLVKPAQAAPEAALPGSLKRKAESSSDTLAASAAKKQKSIPKIPRPILSPDAQFLLDAVLKSEEKALRQALAKSITDASPAHLVAYKELLGSFATSVRTPLHCVRCHASYIELENNARACGVPHKKQVYFDIEVDDLSSDGEDARNADLSQMMVFRCCGTRFHEDMCSERDFKEWKCIQGRHTTNPEEVKYFVKPSKKGKQRDYYSRSGDHPNVVTCKEKKCPGA